VSPVGSKPEIHVDPISSLLYLYRFALSFIAHNQTSHDELRTPRIQDSYDQVQIVNESMRYLHHDIFAQVTEPDPEEVLMLMFSVLVSNGVRKVMRHHLEEWLGLSRANPTRVKRSQAELS
jgi:hypothetical protein